MQLFGCTPHLSCPLIQAYPHAGSSVDTLRASRGRRVESHLPSIHLNISFLPVIVSISTRMHGEFLRLIFLQAHRETEAHFTAAGCAETEPEPSSRTVGPVWKTRETWDEEQTKIYCDPKPIVPRFFLSSHTRTV